MQSQSLDSNHKTEKYVLSLFIVLIFLNFVKPLADYYLGISQRIFTISQMILLLIFFFVVSKKLVKFKFLEFSFLLLIFLRFLTEIVIDYSNLPQAAFSLFKFIVIIWGIKYMALRKFSFLFYKRLEKTIWIYFYITIVISIIQAFNIPPFGVVFSKFGGNILSGNALGVVRTTGGIGGTVIDYAGFVIMYYIIMVSNYKIKLTHFFALIISSLLVFSRVVFLIMFIGFLYKFVFYLFQKGKILKKILILSFALSLLILFFSNQQLQQINAFWASDESRQKSDTERFEQWKNAKSDMAGLPLLAGVSMGKNTGVPTDGRVVVSDGYFQGFAYDFGLLGLIVYLCYLLYIIFSVSRNKKVAFLVTLLLFTTLIINSGIDKPSNIIILFAMFAMLKMNKEYISCMAIDEFGYRGTTFFNNLSELH